MNNMIAPIPKEVLKKELSADKFLRYTNYSSNHIYVVTAHNSPNVMQEIGRLREYTFRDAGGGTGKPVDIDSYDTAEVPYKQLIVWDPELEKILGGYRFIDCAVPPIDEQGNLKLATKGLFQFSETFKKEYLPYTIELGRSFVQPDYQASKVGRKGLFALDNLWDGLGALTMTHPHIKHFFGKVTMYLTFNKEARDLILHFFKSVFPDPKKLVYPVVPLDYFTDAYKKISFTQPDYKANYKILSAKVRELGENIPPLINSYMNLSASMKTFGTALNTHFGNVEETGILITIDDIYESKKHRHISTYNEMSTYKK